MAEAMPARDPRNKTHAAQAQQVEYQTNFNDSSGWSFDPAASGVGWAVDGSPSSVPGGAANSASTSLNYNNGTDFDNGAINQGGATSPLIDISNYENVDLRFWCNYETEMTGTVVDQRWVQVSSDGFTSVVVNLQLSTDEGYCAAMGTWHQHIVPLDPAC